MGFAKAFKLAPVNQLTSNISATAGVLWLAACLLFITAAILFLLNKSEWWIIAIVALIDLRGDLRLEPAMQTDRSHFGFADYRQLVGEHVFFLVRSSI